MYVILIIDRKIISYQTREVVIDKFQSWNTHTF